MFLTGVSSEDSSLPAKHLYGKVFMSHAHLDRHMRILSCQSSKAKYRKKFDCKFDKSCHFSEQNIDWVHRFRLNEMVLASTINLCFRANL